MPSLFEARLLALNPAFRYRFRADENCAPRIANEWVQAQEAAQADYLDALRAGAAVVAFKRKAG